MDKREQSIIEWCLKHRPSLIPNIRRIQLKDTTHAEAFEMLLNVGFEAGRTFQSQNPLAPLDEPTIYLQDGGEPIHNAST